jgi:hypothetical protein
VNYNTPSLVSSLFRRIFSQKREISGPTTFAKLADIRNKFFTNQTKELLELLPQLKGGNSEALAQSLAFPVGTKRGFANLQKAEVAIQEFINNSWIVNNNLIGSLRFNCEEEKLSLPDLQKQESLSKKLSNLLWEKEPPSLKELTIAAKGVIQMSENLSKLQETYKKEFKKNKIPQWEKVFDELYQKLRTLSKNQGNPTKEECETQIQNFKTEFQAVQAQIMAQDLPQSKGYEILREDIDHLIAAKSPGGWLHNQPPE